MLIVFYASQNNVWADCRCKNMKKRIYQHYICRKNVSGGIIALYVGGGIALESYLQKRLYEHTFPQLAVFRFLSWLKFVSSVGRVLFPQLAVFHFLSWLHFTSSVGRYSFPQLAVFHFLSWPKHYQKKLFLHGRTIASYTRLTLLRQLFFALKIAKP